MTFNVFGDHMVQSKLNFNLMSFDARCKCTNNETWLPVVMYCTTYKIVTIFEMLRKIFYFIRIGIFKSIFEIAIKWPFVGLQNTLASEIILKCVQKYKPDKVNGTFLFYNKLYHWYLLQHFALFLFVLLPFAIKIWLIYLNKD